jgi:hypothetical protein
VFANTLKLIIALAPEAKLPIARERKLIYFASELKPLLDFAVQ